MIKRFLSNIIFPSMCSMNPVFHMMLISIQEQYQHKLNVIFTQDRGNLEIILSSLKIQCT